MQFARLASPKTQCTHSRHAFLHLQVLGTGLAVVSERGREDLNHAVGKKLATNGTNVSESSDSHSSRRSRTEDLATGPVAASPDLEWKPFSPCVHGRLARVAFGFRVQPHRCWDSSPLGPLPGRTLPQLLRAQSA